VTLAATPVDKAGAALAAESARFASFGWMRGTSGNLSVVLSRQPLSLVITASGKDKGSLTAADIVVVDADGRAVGANPHRPPTGNPSPEAVLHARVAMVAGAGAVVHVHTVASVVASRRWPAGVELSDVEMLKGIGLSASGERFILPVIENWQDMFELADRLEAARHHTIPAVVVADHGLYAWGDDLLQARHHTEIVQWLLELVVALP
jgi:methylthioribulose-1-phosphate dehydratase